jgi:hypothetical protein
MNPVIYTVEFCYCDINDSKYSKDLAYFHVLSLDGRLALADLPQWVECGVADEALTRRILDGLQVMRLDWRGIVLDERGTPRQYIGTTEPVDDHYLFLDIMPDMACIVPAMPVRRALRLLADGLREGVVVL